MTKGANGTCVGECPARVAREHLLNYKTVHYAELLKIHSQHKILTVYVDLCFVWSVDINECRDGTHQCRYNQICENTRGSYHCTCPRGYRSQGVGRPCLGTYAFCLLPHVTSLIVMGKTEVKRKFDYLTNKGLVSS